MLRKLIPALLVCVPLSLSLVHSFSGGGGTITPPNPNPQPQPSPSPVPWVPPTPECDIFGIHPLLTYDISGFTLTGVLHIHLAVYSSGTVSISSAGGGAGPFPYTTKADVAFLPIDQVQKLWSAVMQAGAMGICDINDNVADLPLTTVTIYRGTQNQAAHSYSYFIPSTTPAGNVHQLIQDFITNTFPNF